MTLKVSIYSEDYPPNYGGIAQWAKGIAEQLHQLGCEINVVCRYHSHLDNPYSWPFPVKYVQRQHWKRLRSFYWRSELSQQISDGVMPDVVIGSKWSTTRGLVGLCQKHRIPLVTVVHGTDVTRSMSQFKKWLLKATLAKSQLIVSVSQFTADYLIENFRVDPDKVVVLPNGVDLDQFRDAGDVEALRKSLGLGANKVILTLSRVIERKGHDLVLRALPLILKQRQDIRYVVAGPGSTAEMTRLQDLCRELDIENYVIFTSYVPADQLNAMYSLCDVYTMPSRFDPAIGDSEGFGITYLEANAFKKPAIGGLSGGCVDAIVNGETGYLVDPHNPAELADRILELLEQPEQAERLGRQGYERIEREFNWAVISKNLLAILQDKVLHTG